MEVTVVHDGATVDFGGLDELLLDESDELVRAETLDVAGGKGCGLGELEDTVLGDRDLKRNLRRICNRPPLCGGIPLERRGQLRGALVPCHLVEDDGRNQRAVVVIDCGRVNVNVGVPGAVGALVRRCDGEGAGGQGMLFVRDPLAHDGQQYTALRGGHRVRGERGRRLAGGIGHGQLGLGDLVAVKELNRVRSGLLVLEIACAVAEADVDPVLDVAAVIGRLDEHQILELPLELHEVALELARVDGRVLRLDIVAALRILGGHRGGVRLCGERRCRHRRRCHNQSGTHDGDNRVLKLHIYLLLTSVIWNGCYDMNLRIAGRMATVKKSR